MVGVTASQQQTIQHQQEQSGVFTRIIQKQQEQGNQFTQIIQQQTQLMAQNQQVTSRQQMVCAQQYSQLQQLTQRPNINLFDDDTGVASLQSILDQLDGPEPEQQ